MRPFDGDFASLTSLRLRRLIWFLRRWNLLDTANALEQETGVSFQAAYLRMLLYHRRWEDAEAYAEGFVDLADFSPLASIVLTLIRIAGVMAKFTNGEASTVDAASFRRLDAALLACPRVHAARRTLLSMRSDPDKASRLYLGVNIKAVNAILNWVADCPEFKAKARPPPRCMFDRTYIISLGPRFWECKRRGQKNKAGRRIPARVLARHFTRKSCCTAGEERSFLVPGFLSPSLSPVRKGNRKPGTGKLRWPVRKLDQ